MEKYKEIKKKHYSDTRENNIDGSKSFTNNAQLSARADHTTTLPFFSRSKHISRSVVKKSNVFAAETRSNFKVNSEQYRIKRNSNSVVNALSIENNVSKWNLEHCRNFNANIYNIHPSLCNLACPVSEISQLNGVLKFQSSRNDIPKYAKNKQRSVFSDKRVCNLKNPISNVTFANCKYSPTGNCSDRSTSSPWNSQHTDPYVNVSKYKTVSESVANEDYSLKYQLKYPSSSNEFENVTDLPIFVPSNFTTDAFKVKYCVERNLGKNSQLQKFNSTCLDETDKIIFPALPSNCHGQIKSNSNHANSMISLHHSAVDKSELVSVPSFPKENTYSSSNMNSAVPQASYADIIRMSSGSVQDLTTADFQKIKEKKLSQGLSSLQSKFTSIKNEGESSDSVNSRLSQPDQNSQEVIPVSSALSVEIDQNVVAPHPIVINLKKPSFYNSCLSNNECVSSFNPSTNLIAADIQGLKDGSHVNDTSSFEAILPDNMTLLSKAMQATYVLDISKTNSKVNNSKTDSISNINYLSDKFENTSLSACSFPKSNDPPVVMNSSSTQIMSEISFGIEYEEMIRLCASDSDTSGRLSTASFHNCCVLEKQSFSITNSELSKAQSQCENNNSTSIAESSDAFNQYIDVKNKRIYWSDPDCDQKYNFQQINQYFACVWKEFEESAGIWKEDEDCDKDDSHLRRKTISNSSFAANS